MRVESLVISQRLGYDTPGELVGIVQIKGEEGGIEIRLPDNVISGIFALINNECQHIAKRISAEVIYAITEVEEQYT